MMLYQENIILNIIVLPPKNGVLNNDRLTTGL